MHCRWQLDLETFFCLNKWVIVFPKYAWFWVLYVIPCFVGGQFSQGLITAYYGSVAGLCILSFQGWWDNGSVEKKGSLLREGAPGPPTICSPAVPETGLSSPLWPWNISNNRCGNTIQCAEESRTRACGMAGARTMLSLRTAFVTWELKPFALFQWTVPLSGLPIALWPCFEGHYMTFLLWLCTPREHKLFHSEPTCVPSLLLSVIWADIIGKLLPSPPRWR